MFRTRYGNKYGAKKASHNGYTYHSKKESRYAAELDLRQKAGEIVSWDRQVRIPLTVNDRKICDYIIDFVLWYPDGVIEYVEVKGFETDVWRLKWKLFESLYSERPQTRLLVVK